MKKVIEYIIENWGTITLTGLSLYQAIAVLWPTVKSKTIVRLIIWILENVDKFQIKKKV